MSAELARTGGRTDRAGGPARTSAGGNDPARVQQSAPAAGRGEDPRVVRTRAAVREAATRLFLEHGYDGTTMEAIAAAAGLAKR
ncbi:MAG: TetR family transcriptional regulator, partial [Candidatus Cloacimonetes bacterium]|nr:TetR family transcriptional regulator [Candidatus Cloacimonadota bacterium]